MAGIPGLENFTSGMDFGAAWTITKFVFWGAIVGVIGFMLWYFLSFNVRVEVFRRTNEGFIAEKDKARFKNDKNNPGVQRFQLLRNKKRWDQPLDRKYLTGERRAFGRYGLVARFVEDAEGRLQPIRPVQEKDVVAWKGWDNNAMEFTTSNIKEVIERYKKGDWLTKYGPLIQLAFFAFLLIAMIVLFRELKTVSESLSSVAGALQNIANQMQPLATNSTSQVIVG